MTDDDRELAAASGAYALDALEGQEARDFEALLARSPGLRSEVVELTDTAVELGLAVPAEEPPAALRASILAAVAGMPQTADTPADAAPLAPVTPIAWYRRPVGALTAAAASVLLAVAVAVGGGALQSASDASRMAAIADAPDAQHASAPVAGGGTARVVWSDALGRAGISLAGMKTLDVARTYQLWYIHGSTARPAGTVAGGDELVLQGAMHEGDVIGVTVEPAGGSPRPTSAPVVAVPTT